MKKILLGAAFASMAMGAVAAGVEMPANLIKNYCCPIKLFEAKQN